MMGEEGKSLGLNVAGSSLRDVVEGITYFRHWMGALMGMREEGVMCFLVPVALVRCSARLVVEGAAVESESKDALGLKEFWIGTIEGDG